MGKPTGVLLIYFLAADQHRWREVTAANGKPRLQLALRRLEAYNLTCDSA
jgi:hypothetical protein